MMIEQTVEINEGRQIFLKVPEEIPAGRVTITFTAEDKENQRIRSMLNQYYQNTENTGGTKREPLSRCIASHPGFFGGNGVAYQRKLRDEWDS